MNRIVSFRLCKLSDKELIEKVDELTDNIYLTGKIPDRHIPARPEIDYDLLVGELLVRFSEMLEREKEKITPTESLKQVIESHFDISLDKADTIIWTGDSFLHNSAVQLEAKEKKEPE